MVELVNAVPALVADPAVDVSGVITALNGTITSADVAALMAQIVGAGSLIYLTWVFGRKAIGAFYRAVRGRAPIKG